MTTSTSKPTPFNHVARQVGEAVQRRIDTLKIGQKMQDLPEELWHESFRYYVKEDPNRKGGPNLRMIRLDPKRPSLTVTGYIYNKFVHPYENRFISVREAARLQGFPDDIKFEGALGSVQLQVGNAVPAPLARAVFTQLACHAKANGYDGKLSAFSLFSGAGGMDIGAEQSGGIDARVALEYWKDACDTLRGYFKDRLSVVQESILDVADPLEMWKRYSGLEGFPDIVYGGPPCQAFSQAGKQKALDDDRGRLIFEFLRFVESLKPAYFVMENVSNLRGVGGGELYQNILDKMNALGYEVTVAPLLAADFGAAQLRVRLFFVGVKRPLRHFEMPEPTHSDEQGLFSTESYLTVGDVFAGLPIIS